MLFASTATDKKPVGANFGEGLKTRREGMKSDTVAVHGGYETEPTTRAVAVPIYQTVAYEFDSAEHGAALFNLEADGHRRRR